MYFVLSIGCILMFVYRGKSLYSKVVIAIPKFDRLRSPSRLLSSFNPASIIEKDNVKQTLLNLIKLGDDWIATKRESSMNINYLQTEQGYHPVPGCIAAVKIKVHPQLKDEAKVKNENYGVVVSGLADSRVALGMLALVAKLFKDLSYEEILAIQPSEYMQSLGIQQLLPPGRLNGFQSMITTIQQILQQETSESPAFKAMAAPSTVHAVNDIVIDTIAAKLSLLTTSDINSSSSPTLASASSSSSSPSFILPDLNDPRSQEIAVLLSGGVDSSVALAQLVEQGQPVRAYYLKIWLEDELAHLNSCPWEEDLAYCRQVCDQLSVPLETLSLQKEYWQYVVTYTLEEAQQGRTPNPDIMCNSRIKFGMFYEYIGKYHKQIATGHYARTATYDQLPSTIQALFPLATSPEQQQPAAVLLQKSPDPIKDQSYFLSNLTPSQLTRCLFPIGHLPKEQVRWLAKHHYNLPTQDRKDSQGICFLGKLKFDEFIAHYLKESPGEIHDYVSGTYMGQHAGLWYHTIGQRKGLGLLFTPGLFVQNGPWFVAEKDLTKNILYVTNDLSVIDLPRRSFEVGGINWILGQLPLPLLKQQHGQQQNGLEGEEEGQEGGGFLVDVKLRHGPTVIPGYLYPIKSSSADTAEVAEEVDGYSVRVELLSLDKGIAAGQFAAFYLGDYCLGAGHITRTMKDEQIEIQRIQTQQEEQLRLEQQQQQRKRSQ